MAGSSWKRPEIRGEAPMRSPADTNTEFSTPARARRDVRRQEVGAPDAAEIIGRRGDVAVEVIDGQDAEWNLFPA